MSIFSAKCVHNIPNIWGGSWIILKQTTLWWENKRIDQKDQQNKEKSEAVMRWKIKLWGQWSLKVFFRFTLLFLYVLVSVALSCLLRWELNFFLLEDSRDSWLLSHLCRPNIEMLHVQKPDNDGSTMALLKARDVTGDTFISKCFQKPLSHKAWRNQK